MKKLLMLVVLLGNFAFACPNANDHKFVEGLESISVKNEHGFDGYLAIILEKDSISIYSSSIVDYVKQQEKDYEKRCSLAYKIYSKSKDYAKNHNLKFEVEKFNLLDEGEIEVKNSYENTEFGVTINIIEMYNGIGEPLGIYRAVVFMSKEEFKTWNMDKFSEFVEKEVVANATGGDKKYNFLDIWFDDGTGLFIPGVGGEASYGFIDKDRGGLLEYSEFGKIFREEGKYKYYTKPEWDKLAKQ